MTRLIFSTTMRNVNPGNSSGYIYVYDLEKETILRRTNALESPYRYVDPNPRGGVRGAKGITQNKNLILISNSHSVFMFDRNWSLMGIISHPSCAGIHDILLDEQDKLWITSTRNDILCKFDLRGSLLDFTYVRDNQVLQKTLNWSRKPLLSKNDVLSGSKDFRDPRTHELTRYDSTHLNSICKLPQGGFLISLGLVVDTRFLVLIKIKESLVKLKVWPWIVKVNHKLIDLLGRKKDIHSDLVMQPATGKSAVVRIWPDGRYEPCLVIDGQHVPSHSVAALPDGTAFYLNSTSGNLIHFNYNNQQVLSDLHVTDRFLRGVLILSDQNIIMGSQNSLVLINFRENQILKRITFSEDSNEAVFAINHLPEAFTLPPENLSSELDRYEREHGKHIEYRYTR